MKPAPSGPAALSAPITGSRSLQVLLCATLVPIIAGQFCQVSLPRLGPVRATWQHTGQSPLAAFLGLPYAAPPVGPLRFMPPGAPARRAGNQPHWHQAADTGRPVQVRSHDRFGPACVNLADWLEPAARDTAEQQSEDCLLANVFVPVPEAKWRQYTATTATTTTTPQQAANQTNQGLRLWPLPVAAKRLPVLVLVHGEPAASGPQNMSLPYLELARRAILVTFGYRHTLLGFLPLSGSESASISSSSEVTRSNHAIWDQVALLHWLQHNVIHFGGEPTNISLQAADNKAAQLLQLLALSPMAKGLFRRLVIVRSERQAAEPALTSSLLSGSLAEARDSRLRLSLALKQAVTQLQGAGRSKELTSSDVLSSLQTASLTQLATLDSQLKQLLPAKVLALALGPSLDDKHLFPYSSMLARQLELLRPQPITSNHINYLIYVRRLRSHAGHHDELGLLQPAGRAGHLNNSGGPGHHGWYRSSSNLYVATSSTDAEEVEDGPGRQRRNMATIASHFEHLRSLNLLVRLLSPATHSDKSAPLTPIHHYQPEVSNSTHLCAAKEVRNLDSQLASFDLLMGHYVDSHSDTPQEEEQQQQREFNGTFNNIINSLLENSTTFNGEMLTWLKFSNLHSSASFMAANCDKPTEPESHIRPGSTYVFFNQQVASENGFTNWVQDAIQHPGALLQSVQNFVESGNPDLYDWPPYESLTKGVGEFEVSDEEMSSIRNQATIFLDLIPYLSQPPQTWSNHEDLFSCLVHLNTTYTPRKTNPIEPLAVPKCLLTEMDKLRATIRHLAHHDLEPIQQLLKTHQETSMSARNAAPNDNLIIEPEVLSSDAIPASGAVESPEVVYRTKSKHLMRNADGEATGLVGGAIVFVKSRPLFVVVTTGLVIFFLNLAIVLVIAIRTRKKRRVVDSLTKPEISIHLPSREPQSQLAVKRLTFELPEESSSPNTIYNTQLMLLEPPVLGNHVPAPDNETFLIGSPFASQSTCSNNSLTNNHGPQTVSANYLGPAFHSPCTSNDTCTLTPIQNSLFELNTSHHHQELLAANQMSSNDVSEILVCSASQKSPVDQQNSDLFIITPYSNHYFINHQA